MNIKKIYRIGKDTLINIISKVDLTYVVEDIDWSIMQDGLAITNNLSYITSKVTRSKYCLSSHIIHFGSMHTYINDHGIRATPNKSLIVVTVFHIAPESKLSKFIYTAIDRVDVWHTSTHITKQQLIQLGVEADKIIVIPLGIDLNLFKPSDVNKKKIIRKQLGISDEVFVIGSFQKDGQGWGNGEEPKLIKGPDIYCDVLEHLAKRYKICAYLTGPARGYVKNRLKKAGIPYIHKFEKDFKKLSKHFIPLDAYLISSRIEGGPKAILESWATGTPVVSAKVGMVTDIANSHNAILCNVEGVDSMVRGIESLIINKSNRDLLIKQGLQTVTKYSWRSIALQYRQKIYALKL